MSVHILRNGLLNAPSAGKLSLGRMICDVTSNYTTTPESISATVVENSSLGHTHSKSIKREGVVIFILENPQATLRSVTAVHLASGARQCLTHRIY